MTSATGATGATAIVIAAPPPQEDVRLFVNMTHLLADNEVVPLPLGGAHVPQLLVGDEARGFLFADAITTLVRVQRIDPNHARYALLQRQPSR